MMDEVDNPYSPGAGRPPAALAGRDGPLKAWRVALDRVAADRGAQPVVLYGLRGVGKTVLLGRYAAQAREREWIVAKLEAGSGKSFRTSLSDELRAPLADLAALRGLGRRMLSGLKTAVSFFNGSVDAAGTWTVGLDLSAVQGGGADSGALESDLVKLLGDLSAAAAERGTAVAVLIDEAQDLTREELAALIAVAHRASQENWRILFALAGLPSLPRVLAEAKSYAERLFDYQHVEKLAEEPATSALVAPALQAGVTWHPEAVELVLARTGGYPYFLQQFGQDVWNAAPGPDHICLQDARVGAERGQAALDVGFYRARWDRATPGEKKYLTAMAADHDGNSSAGEVARRLGTTVQAQGPNRAKLIDKGLIYAPEHGVVAFTVPGMAGFISRQYS